MRIGIVADGLDAKITGISSYTLNLISSLLDIDSKNEYYIIHHLHSKLPFKNNNVRDIVISAPFFDPNRTISRSYAFMKKLRKYDFDIIHDLVGSAMMFNNEQINIQTIFDASCFTVPKSHTFVNKLINVYILKKTISKVDYIITPSFSSKKDLSHYFNFADDKINVTYLAADKERFYQISNYQELQQSKIIINKYNVSKPYILSVGSLVARKNIVTLIKSFLKIKKEHEISHKLVLIGARPKRTKSLPDYFKNNPDIIFTGYVQDNELNHFYNNADCFIFPSLYEGFGLPVLEAMQAGCPVITSNISSLPEVAGKAAFLLNNPLSTTDLGNLILKVINNKDLSTEMIKKGLSQAEKFSWNKCAIETLDVYKKSYNKYNNIN